MNTMRDMKSTMNRHDDMRSLAKSVADGAVLGVLLIVLCILVFVL